MLRTRIALPLALLTTGSLGVATAAPAAAGASATCSFTTTTTAAVTSVALPDPVRAGSDVTGVVTITRAAGSTGPVEVNLEPASWTRTNVCVVVPAGRSSASFGVAISPVTTDGEQAVVGAYATPDGGDVTWAASRIVVD